MTRLYAAVAGFGVLLAWGVPVRDLGELAPDTRSVSVSANVSEVSPEVLTGVVQQYCVPVSYTHLTLPTIYSV